MIFLIKTFLHFCNNKNKKLGEQRDLQSLACPIGTPMKREAVDNNDSKSDVSSYCREPLRKKAAVEGKYFQIIL